MAQHQMHAFDLVDPLARYDHPMVRQGHELTAFITRQAGGHGALRDGKPDRGNNVGRPAGSADANNYISPIEQRAQLLFKDMFIP